MIYQKALKWLGFVAICLGMVYFVYNLGYDSGEATVTAEHLKQVNELNKQITELTDKRNADIVNITTDFHKKNNVLSAQVGSLTDKLNSGGLRNDLRRKSCVSEASDTTRDTGSSQCGLRERDVSDLIGLATRADQLKVRLIACQKTLKTLMN